MQIEAPLHDSEHMVVLRLRLVHLHHELLVRTEMSDQDLELVHPVAGAEPHLEVPVSGHHRRGQRRLPRWVSLEKTPLCVEPLAQVCLLLATLG